MNSNADISNDPDAIRSDIDSTRQRMDQTIDAIGERLKGRHIVDEILGFFRPKPGEEGRTSELTQKLSSSASELGGKISSSASSAFSSVTETVKANPVPALLIGAGVAWFIYDRTRNRNADADSLGYGYGDAPYSGSDYDPSFEYATGSEGSESGYTGYRPGTGIPLSEGDYNGGTGDIASEATSSGGGSGGLKEKASQVGQRVSETASNVTAQAQEKARMLRDRASQMGSQVGERSRHLYSTGRERVVTTVDQHPLEAGLVTLALGIVAGLALPTPRKLEEVAGPHAQRIRERARTAGQDVVQRGRHVVEAATSALKQEIQNQGLTPDGLKQKASAVVDKTKQAATETARSEGIVPGGGGNDAPATEPAVARSV